MNSPGISKLVNGIGRHLEEYNTLQIILQQFLQIIGVLLFH